MRGESVGGVGGVPVSGHGGELELTDPVVARGVSGSAGVCLRRADSRQKTADRLTLLKSQE